MLGMSKISLGSLCLSFLLLSACAPIMEPDETVIEYSHSPFAGLEWNDMVNDSAYLSEKNLLYIAVEDHTQNELRSKAPEWVGGTRIEELAWWLHAPDIQNLYKGVLRVPHDRFNKENVTAAISYLEEKGVPYDIFFLVHGAPNHLTTTKGFPLLSWKDIGELKGHVKNLDTIYSQSCFGTSLDKDWLEVGANRVISYTGLTRNYFYMEFFLKNLIESGRDFVSAFDQTNATVHEELRKSEFHLELINILDFTIDEYIDQAPNPVMTEK